MPVISKLSMDVNPDFGTIKVEHWDDGCASVIFTREDKDMTMPLDQNELSLLIHLLQGRPNVPAKVSALTKGKRRLEL